MIRSGYEIMETNYNIPKAGEIDIISRDKKGLVFSEVKTRIVNDGFNEKQRPIDEKKSDRNMNAAQYYMDKNKLDCNFRFEIREVKLGRGKPKITIIQEALSVY